MDIPFDRDSLLQEEAKNTLKPLTALSATALVVGNMIGVGLVTTTGFLSGELGHVWMILGVWLLGGLLALCGAVVYAELGAMMPRAGGEYIYLSRGLHPMVGFLSGWVSLLVGFSAPVALTAHAFGIYLEAALAALPAKLSAAALIVLLSLLHLGKVAWGAHVHTALTAYKVVLVVAFIALAMASGNGDWANLSLVETVVDVDALAIGLVFVAFAYSGWNVAAYVAGEIRDVERALPRSLIWGTGIVVLLFLMLNVTFFYAAPPAQLAESPEEVAYVAARVLFGDTGAAIVSLLIAIALISSVSAMIMAGPRVYAAMAEDGVFFQVFRKHSKGGSPWASVLLQAVIALAMLYSSTFENLLTYIGVMLSVFAGLTVATAFKLRWQSPEARRPYRAALWPLSGALYLAMVSGMVVFALANRPEVLWACLATVIIGSVLYILQTRRRHRRK